MQVIIYTEFGSIKEGHQFQSQSPTLYIQLMSISYLPEKDRLKALFGRKLLK